MVINRKNVTKTAILIFIVVFSRHVIILLFSSFRNKHTNSLIIKAGAIFCISATAALVRLFFILFTMKISSQLGTKATNVLQVLTTPQREIESNDYAKFCWDNENIIFQYARSRVSEDVP